MDYDIILPPGLHLPAKLNYTLQELLTHSSPQMTQRYAHLLVETLMKAARLADAMLMSEPKETE